MGKKMKVTFSKSITILGLLIGTILLLSLSGCSLEGNKSKEKIQKAQIAEQIEANTEEEIKKGNLSVSIDGISYSLPCKYVTLAENGWVADFSETEYTEESVLSGEEYTGSIIPIKKDGYDEEVEFCIGLVNNGQGSKALWQCDIWAMDMNIRNVQGNYPEIELPNGLRWNDTTEKAKELYGELETIYEEDNYVTYVYGGAWQEGHDVTTLRFRDNMLVEVSLHQY